MTWVSARVMARVKAWVMAQVIVRVKAWVRATITCPPSDVRFGRHLDTLFLGTILDTACHTTRMHDIPSKLYWHW